MPLFVPLPPGAATVSRYVALSFAIATSVVLVALGAKTVWGITAPVFVLSVQAVLAVHIPVFLFTKRYRRELLGEEELVFLGGAVFAVWFYHGFLSIVAHALNRDAWTSLQVFAAILAAGLELVLVCAMVFWSAPFIARLLFLRADESPPNNRWRGP